MGEILKGDRPKKKASSSRKETEIRRKQSPVHKAALAFDGVESNTK